MSKACNIKFAIWFIFLAGSFVSNASWSQTESPLPSCPATTGQPYPEFGELGDRPEVAVWRDLPSLPANCQSTQSAAAITVALAARFTHTGSIEDIALRLGAISTLMDLNYWSVTDNGWRKMITQAVALESSNSKSKRPDFTASEVLSGETHYFAQNDTRSWGLNIYSFKTLSASKNRLVFLSENVSPIRLGPITLFEPNGARNILTVTKIDDTSWSYYSLAVIKKKAIGVNEKSMINRQAALLRHLVRQPTDREPPLAP